MTSAYRNRARVKVLARCAAMRAAKERKRIAESAAMVDVGGVETDGCLGAHTVRLLAWPNDQTRALAVTVDGEHRRPRTWRGVNRCLSELLLRAMQ